VSGTDQDSNETGLQSIDPELALILNEATDDSNINAVIAFHSYPTPQDLNELRGIGILGGTQYEALPMIAVSATKSQLIEVSRLATVRSIYGVRTLQPNSDPYFENTLVQRVVTDQDLRSHNNGMPVSGRNVTVAVLDTGINSLHNDLNGKVVQNVRLTDQQSAPTGFVSPVPVENVENTDAASGHGTFVAGVIAGNGLSSGGKYNGVAPGANLLGLSAGDFNLTHVLSGFDYVLKNKNRYRIRVINCSFSANTVFDPNDPVNIATRTLSDAGISVVFSAGNRGSGEGTLNPYAEAPWTISVGSTDANGHLASFSSRGVFGISGPSIVAPGVNIAGLRSAASQTGVLGIAGNDVHRLTPGELAFYTTASGTSFSAPQVAGAIALMLEANPSLTTDQVKDILQRSATPVPNGFAHESGAGMLNTHAAVLEAAFPERRMGLYRHGLSLNRVRISSQALESFQAPVTPGDVHVQSLQVHQNTLRATVSLAWQRGANDLGLRLADSSGALKGESNRLNIPGLTGNSEEVTLERPSSETFRAFVSHTGSVGTAETVHGLFSAITIDYGAMSDIGTLSARDQNALMSGLSNLTFLNTSGRFYPDLAVSRLKFAEVFVRRGFAPQYLAASPQFADVLDLTSRTAVESVQMRLGGKLFIDTQNGEEFHPYRSTSRLTAAIAFVKAAGLEEAAAEAAMSDEVTDKASVPLHLRGYADVAVSEGFLELIDNRFDPSSDFTRIEMARAFYLLD
ncbi:MAG: S8 family serine peptidase, partial [Pyrinomonadaceae bacterium]|nr:S8 family serine peptidase [Pyrinomonadaceae bacterium]